MSPAADQIADKVLEQPGEQAKPSLLRQGRATVLLLVALAVAPLLVPSYVVSELTRAMIYGLAACSVGFIIRHGGMVSFGHAAYFGIGAYAVLCARLFGFSEALLIWPLAVGAASLAALLIGALSLQTRGVSFIMITLGFAQMVFFIFSSIQELGAADGLGVSGRDRLVGLSLESTLAFHFTVLVLLGAVLFLLERLSQSPFGLALQGIRQDERRLICLGFNTGRIQLAGFVVSGAVAGLAGALAANFYLYVSPSFLHWLTSGELLVMVALGGLMTLSGGLFGAFVLLMAEAVLSDYTTYWRIVLGPLVILSVLFLREGVHPAIQRLVRVRHG